VGNDVRIAFYLTELYLAQDKVKDAMNLLARSLLEYPMMVPLLIKQAKCLLRLEYFEFS